MSTQDKDLTFEQRKQLINEGQKLVNEYDQRADESSSAKDEQHWRSEAQRVKDKVEHLTHKQLIHEGQKEVNKYDQHADESGSVMDEQRWRNEAQRIKGKVEHLTREQLEAGTADVGHATTHAGHPEEKRTHGIAGSADSAAQNLEDQPVRLQEQDYQRKHHIDKDNQIISDHAMGPSEKIRADHGLKMDDTYEPATGMQKVTDKAKKTSAI